MRYWVFFQGFEPRNKDRSYTPDYNAGAQQVGKELAFSARSFLEQATQQRRAVALVLPVAFGKGPSFYVFIKVPAWDSRGI